jgi:hypothetical protein
VSGMSHGDELGTSRRAPGRVQSDWVHQYGTVADSDITRRRQCTVTAGPLGGLTSVAACAGDDSARGSDPTTAVTMVPHPAAARRFWAALDASPGVGTEPRGPQCCFRGGSRQSRRSFPAGAMPRAGVCAVPGLWSLCTFSESIIFPVMNPSLRKLELQRFAQALAAPPPRRPQKLWAAQRRRAGRQAGLAAALAQKRN